jgi:nitrite reductase/ring-hydroxylating ferredoxin subunit
MSGLELSLAGTYRRRVEASLARVWENVCDWEHLPALHEGSFSDVELLEEWSGGWMVRYLPAEPGRQMERIRLEADREAECYRVTTLEGAAAGSEIRVQLRSVEPHVTEVEAAYHVPERRPDRLERIGAGFLAAYGRLWDEDEAMMRAREEALRAQARRTPPQPVRLGPPAEIEGRLPLTVEIGGEPFRLVRDAGELVVHAARCPHWLGPLDAAPVRNGAVRCPWHGWRFDIRTGENLDGRPCTLPQAPRLTLEAGELWLRPGKPLRS